MLSFICRCTFVFLYSRLLISLVDEKAVSLVNVMGARVHNVRSSPQEARQLYTRVLSI